MLRRNWCGDDLCLKMGPQWMQLLNSTMSVTTVQLWPDGMYLDKQISCVILYTMFSIVNCEAGMSYHTQKHKLKKINNHKTFNHLVQYHSEIQSLYYFSSLWVLFYL